MRSILSATAPSSTPVVAAAAYTGLACGISCEEVSPRPVRTDAALGLRALWDQTVRTVVRIGLIRRRHSRERTQLHATMSGRARSSLVVCALVAILEGAHLVDECPDWTQWSIQLRTGRLVLHHQRATRPSNCRHGRARTVGARASGMT